ncbi:hypothetical protein THAOC_13675, partial [Thalassiosira oceanica]
ARLKLTLGKGRAMMKKKQFDLEGLEDLPAPPPPEYDPIVRLAAPHRTGTTATGVRACRTAHEGHDQVPPWDRAGRSPEWPAGTPMLLKPVSAQPRSPRSILCATIAAVRDRMRTRPAGSSPGRGRFGAATSPALTRESSSHGRTRDGKLPRDSASQSGDDGGEDRRRDSPEGSFLEVPDLEEEEEQRKLNQRNVNWGQKCTSQLKRRNVPLKDALDARKDPMFGRSVSVSAVDRAFWISGYRMAATRRRRRRGDGAAAATTTRSRETRATEIRRRLKRSLPHRYTSSNHNFLHLMDYEFRPSV